MYAGWFCLLLCTHILSQSLLICLKLCYIIYNTILILIPLSELQSAIIAQSISCFYVINRQIESSTQEIISNSVPLLVIFVGEKVDS